MVTLSTGASSGEKARPVTMSPRLMVNSVGLPSLDMTTRTSSRWLATLFPWTSKTVSPGRRPASCAGEFGDTPIMVTVPTTVSCGSVKRVAKTAIGNTRFITEPETSTTARFQMACPAKLRG